MFAYLADVSVLPAYRGRGLGKFLHALGVKLSASPIHELFVVPHYEAQSIIPPDRAMHGKKTARFG